MSKSTPFAIEDVPWESWEQGSRFGSRTKALGEHGGASHVGVVLEELPPGRQAAPSHYHLLEEEHVYMLEGSVTLRLGTEEYLLTPGMYVCFSAGSEVPHSLVNNGSEVCRYLLVGERNPNDVIVYPESKKVMVRSLGEVYERRPVEYWAKEDGA